MIQKISFAVLLTTLHLGAIVETNLQDISVTEPELTVILDKNVQLLCKQITDLYKEHDCPYFDEHIAILIDSQDELDYETVLRALDSLIHDQRSSNIGEAQDLKLLLEQHYNKLLEEYYQLAVQTTRRIKVKFFNRVNTNNLSVTDAHITNAYIKSHMTTECLKVGKLDGVVKSTPGACLIAGPVESTDIADGAIGNIQLADNAVDSSKIANSSIVPTKLNFYPAIANSAEEATLKVYRGSAQSDGTIDNGAGFTVMHLGTGIYQVIFTTISYNNSYNAFIQFSGNNQFATSIDTSHLDYFTFLVRDSAGTLIDYAFTFFTIGS